MEAQVLHVVLYYKVIPKSILRGTLLQSASHSKRYPNRSNLIVKWVSYHFSSFESK